ncbi:2-hydroxychromene-2-carboxylate isomerase [Hansschlegelia beijingensis]|uniref:2-hydroxychromene-2-carboxylate isomerase n=1 Tax=Hansschlegelia beijingensis TaxID=1133344 RepID=UPI0038127A26
MAEPIEFFFDFGSGYSYFASTEIDDLAARHGRSVRWKAFSLGSSFKVTEAKPLTRTPLKAEYVALDWARIARLKGLSFTMPDGHPHAGMPALRGFHWLDAQDPALAVRFAKDVFRAYFSEGLAIDDATAVAEIARPLGADRSAFIAAVASPELKAKARAAGEEAVERGVFGAPWIILDGEPFWGWDRLPMVERRLAEASPAATA